ncbi:redoxin domain-containing protein [uncultured Chryseobacterium sp.]|uniref:TlpA family protein disulfide reductase n=1 Tax=uncultured Chryseobacterium sp. TaxID=259322 RepID=UPI0025F94062|nr:redoxin domain-containing protein [uncultured Chryseobacterium sp.]
MKNKYLKIFAILIPVLVIGMIVYLFFDFQEKKEKIKQLENIPSFTLQTIDGSSFTSQNLNSENHKVIIYFSPDCHFCQAEAEELSVMYKNYKNTEWIWIASEPLAQIKTFAEKYKLHNYKNIHWCYDDKANFYRRFQMKSVPYFLVYDEKNHLINRNSGAIKLTKLLRHFDEKH